MASSENLQQENRRLKAEIQYLRDQLTQKDNLIKTLESQIKILIADGLSRYSESEGTRNKSANGSMASGTSRDRRSSDGEAPPPKPRTSAAVRDAIPMQQPLPPKTKESPRFTKKVDPLESCKSSQLQSVIVEADEEEEDESQSSRKMVQSSRRIMQSTKGAIKALPRELSIFNSEDDDVTKYSIDDGKPTYELEKTEMRDAYNARGLYTGTVSRKEQLPHGRGRMDYHHQGRSYEGDWHMGHWHGYGVIKTPLGDLYEGQVVNDLREGEGKLTYADGRFFRGQFKQDEPVNGTLLFPDGAKYVGDLYNGARHGYGVYHFTDGSKYEGESVMNVFEGKGKMIWTDGGWYEGEWLKGEIHGYGMEVRPDGSLRHRGQWNKGVPIRF